MSLQGIKSIVIGLTAERTESSALSYGLSMAQAAKAHVAIEVLTPKIVLAHPHIRGTVDEVVKAENQRTMAIAIKMAEEARRDAEMQGVPCAAEVTQSLHTDLCHRLAAAARVHDLTLLDAAPDTLDVGRGLLESTLFHSGRPIVVVPPDIGRFVSRRIIVAWDGSDRAARAVGDAMPFLRAAGDVEIVSVSGEKSLSMSLGGVELAPLFARHGVNATLKELGAQNGDVAETLREQAGIYRADMIVMGAFAHSWIRQTMLGGVTKGMLKRCPVALFLSH